MKDQAKVERRLERRTLNACAMAMQKQIIHGRLRAGTVRIRFTVAYKRLTEGLRKPDYIFKIIFYRHNVSSVIPDRAIILITHYQRLLEYVEPDFVHVLSEGRIAHSGDKSLALKLEEQGYEWVREAASA